MKKHLIFDFDDTIASTYDLNQSLFIRTVTNVKEDVDETYLREIHREMRGSSMALQFQKVVTKYDLPVTAAFLVKENELLQQRCIQNVEIFNGFEDLLSSLKREKILVSICSNRDLNSLKMILGKNEIYQHFDNIVSCYEAGHEKPDPYCLLQLIKMHPNIPKEEILYFGDSETDAELASNANIDFLVINQYLNKKKAYAMLLQTFIGL